MPYPIWILIGVLVVGLILGLFGFSIANSVIKPKRRSLLDTSIIEEEKFPGIMDFYHRTLTSQYRIPSRYGYDIQVYFLQNNVSTNRFLVMSHGHTYTHHGCLKYARMMMKYGFNIVLYDQRYHGDTGGKFTSLGWFEKDDLYDIITDTFERFGPDLELGTYGESMGSATVLLEAAIDKRVQYIFSDCGFSNLDTLMNEIFYAKIKKPLRFLLPLTKKIFQLIVKVPMSRISPIEALNTISVPIFFAHGKEDHFILPSHCETMVEHYPNDKAIFLADNKAMHAESYWRDTENYEMKIKEFVNRFVIKN